MVRVSVIACDSVCMGGRGRVTVRARSWTSKVMVSIHVSHKETLMTLKWGSDFDVNQHEP